MVTKEKKSEYSKRHYLKYREKILVRTRNYYFKNAEKSRVWRRNRHLKVKFGITEDEFQKILEKQDGICAICGREQYGRTLDVDHCHKTGRIRGILCHRCNMGLGYFQDNIELLEKAKKYIKKHELK